MFACCFDRAKQPLASEDPVGASYHIHWPGWESKGYWDLSKGPGHSREISRFQWWDPSTASFTFGSFPSREEGRVVEAELSMLRFGFCYHFVMLMKFCLFHSCLTICTNALKLGLNQDTDDFFDHLCLLFVSWLHVRVFLFSVEMLQKLRMQILV